MINFTVIPSATSSPQGEGFLAYVCAYLDLGVMLGLSCSVSMLPFPPASSPPWVTAKGGSEDGFVSIMNV